MFSRPVPLLQPRTQPDVHRRNSATRPPPDVLHRASCHARPLSSSQPAAALATVGRRWPRRWPWAATLSHPLLLGTRFAPACGVWWVVLFLRGDGKRHPFPVGWQRPRRCPESWKKHGFLCGRPLFCLTGLFACPCTNNVAVPKPRGTGDQCCCEHRRPDDPRRSRGGDADAGAGERPQTATRLCALACLVPAGWAAGPLA